MTWTPERFGNKWRRVRVRLLTMQGNITPCETAARQRRQRIVMNLTRTGVIALMAACATIGLSSLNARADDKDSLKHATAHLNRAVNKSSKSANRDLNRASKSTNRNMKRNSKRINHNVPKEVKRESKDVNHTAQGDPEGKKK